MNKYAQILENIHIALAFRRWYEKRQCFLLRMRQRKNIAFVRKGREFRGSISKKVA